MTNATPAANVNSIPKPKKDKDDVFPHQLYRLLENVHTMGYNAELPITWLPHGRAFIVKNTGVFVKEIMPRFWKAKKLRSFTRQLCLWGYKRSILSITITNQQ
ncbi:predicted protein [Thalassiosira pseudonana CCMP1335]|uniref:HSF-type DNA-binding domain-containing protein n=1 Tax=Thalassiosira pseudonana TaxID=35128 RepID=B8CF29_THAPS|nr:predicted protein [Thalassiosira pseudonana CCMP1335]EED88007.1 predicted protein [Thalassiosira pseudonana CCMP1335]